VSMNAVLAVKIYGKYMRLGKAIGVCHLNMCMVMICNPER